MSSGIAARRAALDLLEGVLDKGLALDEVKSPLFAALEARDRGFAHLTALTVLRHLGQIDAILAVRMERPPVGSAKRAMHLLRIGTAQLLILETPAHAAVDACVAACKESGLAKMAGLVNAILRRLAREMPALPAPLATMPDWLRQDWEKQFGQETAAAIAAAQLTEPPTDLSLGKDPETWAKQLPGALLPGTKTLRLAEAGDVTALPGFAEGAWWVQDVAATIPALLLGDVAGKSVIDLCAAPGGKTAQLLAAGASVTAVDRSAARLKRLRENLDRLGQTATVVEADATAWRPDQLADAVLLDAPCSATGTLRRHPEIAYRRGPADVSKLAALQKRLLEAASAMLKPGGRIVVATCSLQQAEGPALARHGANLAGLKLDPIHPEELPGFFTDAVTPEGWFRSHPAMLSGQGHCDGFFTARFVKE